MTVFLFMLVFFLFRALRHVFLTGPVIKTQNATLNLNLNMNRQSVLVIFSLNMNLNTNSEGCVTVCVHVTCVDMYDHIVGFVVYHPSSCSLCNHKRTNRIHYFEQPEMKVV